MKKRLKFLCCYCDREYSMTREITGKPTLLVACPFCEKEAVVDLDPYRKNTTSIFKSVDAPDKAIEAYDFPAVLPTSAPMET